MVDKTKIDLACGDRKREGFYGIDIAPIPGVDLVHDLSIYPWPIETDSVDEVKCSHYVEHIPHIDIKGLIKESNSFDEFKSKVIESKDGFINFINELYRIMKPGGKAIITMPYYTSERAFQDPTHTRYIGETAFLYLSKDWMIANKLEHYGIECDFDITISYLIDNELTLKSEEVRQKAFRRDWNSIQDMIIELIKK